MDDVHRTTKLSLVKATTYRAVIVVLDVSVIYLNTGRADIATAFQSSLVYAASATTAIRIFELPTETFTGYKIIVASISQTSFTFRVPDLLFRTHSFIIEIHLKLGQV